MKNKNIQDVNSDRAKIKDGYKWNLQHLFASDKDWLNSKIKLEAEIKKILKFKGKLKISADNLYHCLELYSKLYKDCSLLEGYTHQLADQDLRQSGPMARQQEISHLRNKLSTFTAFIEPEILSISDAVIKSFLQKNTKLKAYQHYLNDIRRLRKHTLSSLEEEVISQTGIMSDNSLDIYEIFKNTDLPHAEITIEKNKKVSLNDANFSLYRAHTNRNIRKKVFTEFFAIHKQYERSFGAQLHGQIKTNVFYKNVRKYNSALERSLSANNIPVSVYENLIDIVHQNLDVLKRYLHLRKKILGVDKLYYYDLYTPLVKSADLNYSFEEARNLVKESLEPLGADYLKVLDEAFNNRWIDAFPNTGKRSGAYASGAAYDVHPYILMNYMGRFNDVSTLTHELGHAIHSYYSNKNQTYINSHYPIFLAEVASTTNESLLVDKVLSKPLKAKERLAILGSQLEYYRTTLFRQTQFAEFELKTHQLVEAGKSLTGEELSNLYLEILRTYYSHNNQDIVIEDLYGIEWAHIPHFYYNFYVFQYSTSLCASTVIAEKISKQGKPVAEKYIKDFLSAGCSDYSIPILKKLGVDMTKKATYQAAFNKMNKIMDEIEAILKLKA